MAIESFIPGSSNIASCAYDGATQELVITFRSGETYTYGSVPQSVWHGLKHAHSAGSYFYRQIRDVFSFRKE